jgi:hypothetical protein
MFLDSDERVIIMDMLGGVHYEPRLLSVDSLHQIAGAGVKTIYLQGAMRWDKMQPQECSPIDWSFLDGYIDLIESAELKALIPFVYRCPDWLPKEWYLLYQDIPFPSSPSYTNPQTGIDLDEFAEMAISRYKSRPMQFIYSIVIDGEFAFNLVPDRSVPDFPEETFLSWMTARQRVFEMQYGEVWNSFHIVDDPPWINRMYDRWRVAFPKAKFYGIQFTHFGHGGREADEISRLSIEHDVRYFVGAEYCQGIVNNTPRAIAEGVGLICAPLSVHNPGQEFEPWMVDAIKQSIDEFRRSDVH